MPSQLITIVQGDNGMDWNFTLTDAQGVVINLTGATLLFFGQLVSDLAVNFNNPMSIVSALIGKCKYTVQPNDFLVAGTYSAQIRVSYGSSEAFRFSDVTVVVEPSLPTS